MPPVTKQPKELAHGIQSIMVTHAPSSRSSGLARFCSPLVLRPYPAALYFWHADCTTWYLVAVPFFSTRTGRDMLTVDEKHSYNMVWPNFCSHFNFMATDCLHCSLAVIHSTRTVHIQAAHV
jgi:hypothetical protein